MSKRNKKRVGPGGKPKGVDLARLPEKIAEGITSGPNALEEAQDKFPVMPGAVDLSYLKKQDGVGVPFRAMLSKNQEVATRFPDGRMFANTDVAMTPENRQRIEQGYVCVKCLESQSSRNADDHIDGCPGVAQYGERYMRDGYHQIDVAAEFTEDGVHVGPQRPLTQYMDEQEQRREKLDWMRGQVERGNSEAAIREFRKLYA